MTTVKITAATPGAITADEAKLHARISGSADDALLTRLIAVVHLEAEAELQRSILPTVWEKRLPCFPARAIELLYPTVTAVTHIKYYDGSGTLITMDSADYQVDMLLAPAIVVPAPGDVWPSTESERLGAVQIRYTAGWADANAVPAAVKQWMLVRLAQLYEHREQVAIGGTIERMPYVDGLLDPYRVVKV